MYVDTHCHLDDDKFNDKAEIVNNFLANGVDFAINMGCEINSSIAGKSLTEKYENVYFGAGFHPNDAEKFNDNSLNELKDIAMHNKCVAIGEIGLDYHYEGFDKAKQQFVFESQISLANSLKMPISIHSRDATFDTIELLKNNKNNLTYGGVMHCFSGSVETAKILLDFGLYISFAGTLTFKNAKNLIDVAKYVPLDRCLTETDSPYLAPEPFRGKRNEPMLVKYVAEKLALIKGVESKDLCEKVYQNALNLFTKIKK